MSLLKFFPILIFAFLLAGCGNRAAELEARIQKLEAQRLDDDVNTRNDILRLRTDLSEINSNLINALKLQQEMDNRYHGDVTNLYDLLNGHQDELTSLELRTFNLSNSIIRLERQ